MNTTFMITTFPKLQIVDELTNISLLIKNSR